MALAIKWDCYSDGSGTHKVLALRWYLHSDGMVIRRHRFTDGSDTQKVLAFRWYCQSDGTGTQMARVLRWH